MLGSWIGFIYFGAAFYITLKDNLPRMVRDKNNLGLFLFTLLTFESIVMALLFWFLYVLLSFVGTTICGSHFCAGSLTGVVAYINVLAVTCSVVVARSYKLLGIAVSDAFGL